MQQNSFTKLTRPVGTSSDARKVRKIVKNCFDNNAASCYFSTRITYLLLYDFFGGFLKWFIGTFSNHPEGWKSFRCLCVSLLCIEVLFFLRPEGTSTCSSPTTTTYPSNTGCSTPRPTLCRSSGRRKQTDPTKWSSLHFNIPSCISEPPAEPKVVTGSSSSDLFWFYPSVMIRFLFKSFYKHWSPAELEASYLKSNNDGRTPAWIWKPQRWSSCSLRPISCQVLYQEMSVVVGFFGFYFLWERNQAAL